MGLAKMLILDFLALSFGFTHVLSLKIITLKHWSISLAVKMERTWLWYPALLLIPASYKCKSHEAMVISQVTAFLLPSRKTWADSCLWASAVLARRVLQAYEKWTSGWNLSFFPSLPLLLSPCLKLKKKSNKQFKRTWIMLSHIRNQRMKCT